MPSIERLLQRAALVGQACACVCMARSAPGCVRALRSRGVLGCGWCSSSGRGVAVVGLAASCRLVAVQTRVFPPAQNH
eukprot:7283862-Pyramimonas_sp.AAC.1